MPRTAPRLLLVLLLTGLHHDVRRLAVLASHGAASPISAPPTACAAHDAADPTVPSALRFISGYTDATYARMRDDAARTEAYRRAIAAHARGRVVLDIGTGGLALLAIMAAQAGASKVRPLPPFPLPLFPPPALTLLAVDPAVDHRRRDRRNGGGALRHSPPPPSPLALSLSSFLRLFLLSTRARAHSHTHTQGASCVDLSVRCC